MFTSLSGDSSDQLSSALVKVALAVFETKPVTRLTCIVLARFRRIELRYGKNTAVGWHDLGSSKKSRTVIPKRIAVRETGAGKLVPYFVKRPVCSPTQAATL